VKATQAIVDSNTANVHRLEELQFSKKCTPLSRVITRRNTDVGALITAGASPGTAAGHHHGRALAATRPPGTISHRLRFHTIRVFVAVPEYTPAKVGVNWGT